MIQRIQSVYLFLAFLLGGAVYFNPLYSHAMDDPQIWIGLGFTAVLAMPSVLSFISIFLYKNRKRQIRWVKGVMFLQVVAFGWGAGILFSLGGFGTFLWDESLGILLLAAAFLLQLLALRSIRNDEELVQSMDRIR